MLVDAITTMFSRTVDVDLSTDKYYVKSNEDGVIRAFSDYDRGIVDIEKMAIAEGDDRDDYVNTFSRLALYDAYRKGIKKITRRYKTSTEGLVDKYVEMSAVFLDSEGKQNANVIILVHEVDHDNVTENLEQELAAKNAEISKLNEENRRIQKTLSMTMQTSQESRDKYLSRIREKEDRYSEESKLLESKYAEESRKLEKENDDLKNKLKEISQYTQELDQKFVERAVLMSKENKKLKEQLRAQREELAKEFQKEKRLLVIEKKQLEEEIEKEKLEIAKLEAKKSVPQVPLSAVAQQELVQQRQLFNKKLEESKTIASNYLDNAYEEMESFIEKERVQLAHKHDLQLMEMAKRFNSEKTEYKKMLANLDEENTALENMLTEERLDYARKLSDAKKNFETKMNVQRMKNAELVAAVAANLSAATEKETPTPTVIEAEPVVEPIVEPEVKPVKLSQDQNIPTVNVFKDNVAPEIETAGRTTIIFSKTGITNLKLDLKNVIQEIQKICLDANVGISLKFGEMANPVVHVDTDEINKVVVGMVRDAAVYARKGSSMVLAISQVSEFKYGYAEYEYKITYIGNRIVFNEKPANHLGGSYKESDNDDGTRSITVRFRWELI